MSFIQLQDIFQRCYMFRMPVFQYGIHILKIGAGCVQNRTAAGFQNNVHRETIFMLPPVDILRFCRSDIAAADAQSLQHSIVILVVYLCSFFCFCNRCDFFTVPFTGYFFKISCRRTSTCNTVFHQIFDQVIFKMKEIGHPDNIPDFCTVQRPSLILGADKNKLFDVRPAAGLPNLQRSHPGGRWKQVLGLIQRRRVLLPYFICHIADHGWFSILFYFVRLGKQADIADVSILRVGKTQQMQSFPV